jgi:magnesium transporter
MRFVDTSDRRDLEARPDLLRRGPVAIMDRVVDDYAPVVAGIENDIDEIEDDVFDGKPARLATASATRNAALGFRELLQNILSVNLTLETKALSETSNAQNEEVKKISAWAAILFAPTLIGTIYGMNFENIPELHWGLGYPFALALMLLTSVTLFLIFKSRGWL